MKLFCKHEWKEIARTYAPSIGQLRSTKGYASKEFLKSLRGITTILWECQKCQKIRREELLGKSS